MKKLKYRITSAEKLSNIRKDFDFAKSNINSPHVKACIDVLVQSGKFKKSEIIKIIEEKTKEAKEVAEIAPKIGTANFDNAAEQAVFTLLWENKIRVPGAPTVNPLIMQELFVYVQANQPRFWPLRDWVSGKTLSGSGMANLILVPTAEIPEEKCKTAYITPKGDVCFNINLAQALIDYAMLKGETNPSKKYKSQGGIIPDCYCYIETVIMHELMHFAYGDFYYDKVKDLAATGMEINYTGDLRSNYKIVASGYPQLPIGLYSKEINFDRHTSYKSMLLAVREELEKLKKAGKQDQLPQPQDSHMDSDGETRENDPNATPSQGGDIDKKPGSGSGSGSGSRSGSGSGGDQDQDQDQDGDDGEGQGKPGNKNEKGKGSGKGNIDDVDISTEDLDKRAAEVDDMINDKKDLDRKEIEKFKQDKLNESKNKSNPDTSGGSNPNSIEVDYSQVRPAFKWQEILRRAVNRAENDIEDTYSKISRKAITRIDQAVKLGSAPVKPGERINEHFKFAIVIDSSGSMSDIIKVVYANLHALFKSKDLGTDCLIYKFSDEYKLFKYNPILDSGKEINIHTGKPIRKVVRKDILSHLNGGTLFSDKLRNELLEKINKGYNVLIISDSDLLWSSNKDNFMRLVSKHRDQVFAIVDSIQTYRRMREETKIDFRNVSCWSKTK